MDNRLRFLYLIMTELWGRMCKSPLRVETQGKRRSGHVGKTACQRDGVKHREIKYRNARSMCREKPLLFMMSPYRKPTQVDEERILRPAGEALSRNSAK